MLSSGKKMIIVISIVSMGFAGYLVSPAMDITAQEQPEVFVTHSGAVVQTTGDIQIRIIQFKRLNLTLNNTYGILITVRSHS